MELLHSSNWTQLSAAGSLSDDNLLHVQQKLRSLAAHGVVHGDLHASNVLISNTGDVRVVDFDLAYASPEEQPTTYPPFLNPALPWAPGAANDAPILSDHDAFLIDIMGVMLRLHQYSKPPSP
jgi:serine/threonine protein kinase